MGDMFLGRIISGYTQQISKKAVKRLASGFIAVLARRITEIKGRYLQHILRSFKTTYEV